MSLVALVPTTERDHATAFAEALERHLRKHFSDPLTIMDRRQGERSASLWVTHSGVEFQVIIKPSARQVARWRRK